MRNKYSNKHYLVENPNWQEADQLAIYKGGQDVELGVSEWDLNPRPTDFKSSTQTIRKRCLLIKCGVTAVTSCFEHLDKLSPNFQVHY